MKYFALAGLLAFLMLPLVVGCAPETEPTEAPEEVTQPEEVPEVPEESAD